MSIKGILEKLNKLDKPNLLRYITYFCVCVLVLSNEVEDTRVEQSLLISLYSFDSIFSGAVWIDKLHSCVEGICFNVYQRNWKKTLSIFSKGTIAKNKKCYISDMNVIDLNYH